MSYPPTLRDLRNRLGDYPAYSTMSDLRLQQAMDAAQGELESAIPRITEGVTDSAESRLVASLCLDLAVYHIKRAVERTETGDLPLALWRERQDLTRRMQMVALLLDSGIKVRAFDHLEEVGTTSP